MALLLTGCTAGPGGGSISEDASGEACAVQGAGSKAVKVEGKFGEEMKLTSKLPIEVGKTLERTVLIQGESSKAFAEGEEITANYTIFNGKTGEVVNTIPDAAMANVADQYNGAEWALEAVRCGAVGQRVAIVTSVEDALAGMEPAEAGFEDLKKTDAFAIVFDFTASEAPAEPCEKLTPRDEKFPEIDLGDGKTEPKITIPECMEPPAELEVKVLEEGDGAVVKDGDVVMTNYVGVKWNGAERFDGTWNETGVRFDTKGLIAGFTQAMVGQKIGSTILVTMPPELGYGTSPGHELEKETLTFVLQLVELTE